MNKTLLTLFTAGILTASVYGTNPGKAQDTQECNLDGIIIDDTSITTFLDCDGDRFPDGSLLFGKHIRGILLPPMDASARENNLIHNYHRESELIGNTVIFTWEYIGISTDTNTGINIRTQTQNPDYSVTYLISQYPGGFGIPSTMEYTEISDKIGIIGFGFNPGDKGFMKNGISYKIDLDKTNPDYIYCEVLGLKSMEILIGESYTQVLFDELGNITKRKMKPESIPLYLEPGKGLPRKE